MNRAEIESYIKRKWKKYYKASPLIETSGTAWHQLGKAIHFIAKLGVPYTLLEKKIYAAEFPFADQKKLDKLIDKSIKYSTLLKRDSSGWIMAEDCDALLYNGLMACTNNVRITVARDKDGWWYRRPIYYPECYECGGSGSSISRYMLTGLMWYLWHNGDIFSADDLYKHAKLHSFVMGKGDQAILIMMPGLESTLANIIYKLGGKNHFLARHQFRAWPDNLDHYELHLLMLEMALFHMMHGYLPKRAVESLKKYAAKNPGNPLHQLLLSLYTDGDLNRVVDILLDEAYFPADRLPNRGDRKVGWLPSRDSYSDDYEPATDGDLSEEHTGGDLIWMAWLVLRNI